MCSSDLYQRIEALAADKDAARALELGKGEPILLVNRVFVDSRGRPVVLFKSHYRADRYIYTVNLPKPSKTRTARARNGARRAKR